MNNLMTMAFTGWYGDLNFDSTIILQYILPWDPVDI